MSVSSEDSMLNISPLRIQNFVHPWDSIAPLRVSEYRNSSHLGYLLKKLVDEGSRDTQKKVINVDCIHVEVVMWSGG